MIAHLLLAAAVLVAANLAVAHARCRPGRRLGHGARHRHTLRYELYLRSPLWRLRRRLWILQTLGRCENCRRYRQPLTIHHLTYQRLGHERRTDVQVLCWGCHQARHSGVRSQARTAQAGGGW